MSDTWVARVDDDGPVRQVGRVIEWRGTDHDLCVVEWHLQGTDPVRTATREEYADELTPVRR